MTAVTLLAAIPAHALPQGGQVVSGQATLSASGATLNITQSTDRAIFNWQSFDIASGELVAFHQPSANSVALNRVTGSQSPSQIFGSLTANGTVMLVNPNGVFFSPTAQVNVGSLVATTGDITNDRFMAGDHRFDIQGNPNAGIVNQGVITVADAGLVAFVAPNVINDGFIQATLGKVQLASGDSFTLDLYGDGLVSLEASSAITSQLVSNSGVILANGGKVTLTAAAAGEVVNSLINMDGIIQATSMAERNGEIVIYAEGSNAVKNNITADKGNKQGSSTVLVSGVLDVSGRNPGERGGKITVTGDNVALLGGTFIDASGDQGGGNIKIGGDYYGEGDTPTSSHTLVQHGATLRADATKNGNGGKVTIWADDWTTFGGSITAKGGINGGDGGFVETSGKKSLTSYGQVNASSTWGKAGLWLLDPNNLTVNGVATANAGSTPDWVAGGGGGNVLNTDINAALNGGTSVSLTASGDLTVASAITKSGGGDATLTLKADNNIFVNSGANITSSNNKLNIVLNADSDASKVGGISITSATLNSNGGNITLGGGADPVTTAAYAAAGMIEGVSLNGATLNAGAGSISLRGNMNAFGGAIGANGGTLIETTTGDISLTASPGTALNNQYPFRLTGSTITTQSGNITLYSDAFPRVNCFNCIGISSSGGTVISSTGAGNVGAISITGMAPIEGAGNSFSFGLSMTAAISSVDADINIDGRLTGTPDASPGSYSIGINNSGTVTSAGNGHINVVGVGGASNGNDWGVLFNGWTLSAQDGAIDVQGTGMGTGANNYGIHLGGNQILSTGTATITLTGIGASGAADIYSNAAAIGGASDLGNITFNADSFDFTSAIIRTSGQVIFQPRTLSSSIGIAGAAGAVQVVSSLLAQVTAGGITIGQSGGTGAVNVDAYSWNSDATLMSGSGTITINGAQTMGAHNFLAQTASVGDITIGASGGVTSSATGTAITLASGHNFINNAGSGALSAASGRWLVYSTDPASDTIGSLSNSFRRFTCAYSGSCPTLGSGNGLLYSYTPTLTATPNAISAIIYGDAVPNLAGYSYGLSGYLASDSAADTVTGSLTGSTPYSAGSNVGSYAINYASGSLASTLGYGFSYANNATGISVGQKALTGSLIGTVSKAYDGTVAATLTSANYALSGVFGSDAVSLNNPVSGTYDTPNSGIAKIVTVNGLALLGAGASNYTLGSTSASAAVGVIGSSINAGDVARILRPPVRFEPPPHSFGELAYLPSRTQGSPVSKDRIQSPNTLLSPGRSVLRPILRASEPPELLVDPETQRYFNLPPSL